MDTDHFYDDGSKRSDGCGKMSTVDQLDRMPLNKQNIGEYLVFCETAFEENVASAIITNYVQEARDWINSNLKGDDLHFLSEKFKSVELALKKRGFRKSVREKIQ